MAVHFLMPSSRGSRVCRRVTIAKESAVDAEREAVQGVNRMRVSLEVMAPHMVLVEPRTMLEALCEKLGLTPHRRRCLAARRPRTPGLRTSVQAACVHVEHVQSAQVQLLQASAQCSH